MLAKLQCRFELAVLEADRLGLYDTLEHQLAFVLQPRVLVRGVPVIACAGKHTSDRRSNGPQPGRHGRGRIQCDASHGSIALWRDQRQAEHDDADNQARHCGKEAEEQPVLRAPGPAWARPPRRRHHSALSQAV